MKKKSKRPISRKFWSLLKYMPKGMRASIIRSKFEVDGNLPNEIVLKQAETEEEIRQALKLVHDSYVELDYIDANEAELRFSKYHALPTTVILVAKWEDEVIGTLSIIPDSALGLPAETTWSLAKYREQGKVMAEISSLCIKKDFRMRRGRLLMPLCKLMYLYCTKILKLDGIVIATTLEVEPFYTDVLLFETVVAKTGQEHQMVKGNPSSCCYLDFGETLVPRYRKAYAGKDQRSDLHNFFMVSRTPNIQLPMPKHCIQSYMVKKNSSQAQIIRDHAALVKEFSNSDKLIIKNLDISHSLSEHLMPVEDGGKFRKSIRPEIRVEGWCFLTGESQPVRGMIMDVSKTGFKMHLRRSDLIIRKGDHFILAMEFNGHPVQVKAEIKWIQGQNRIGCHVVESSLGWEQLINEVLSEIDAFQLQAENIVPMRGRKTA